MTKYDFAAMNASQALDALVELDVARWGEHEREASRRLHSSKSRGLLINSIVYHFAHEFGDVFDLATRKIASAQLTSHNRYSLRRGG